MEGLFEAWAAGFRTLKSLLIGTSCFELECSKLAWVVLHQNYTPPSEETGWETDYAKNAEIMVHRMVNRTRPFSFPDMEEITGTLLWTKTLAKPTTPLKKAVYDTRTYLDFHFFGEFFLRETAMGVYGEPSKHWQARWDRRVENAFYDLHSRIGVFYGWWPENTDTVSAIRTYLKNEMQSEA